LLLLENNGSLKGQGLRKAKLEILNIMNEESREKFIQKLPMKNTNPIVSTFHKDDNDLELNIA
jgi:hypothetical protein